MTVVVSGGSGTISYQWQSLRWIKWMGLMHQAQVPQQPHLHHQATVAGTTYYRVLSMQANNGCDQAVSNNAVALYIT
jgi:hypothetical protein